MKNPRTVLWQAMRGEEQGARDRGGGGERDVAQRSDGTKTGARDQVSNKKSTRHKDQGEVSQAGAERFKFQES